MRPTKLRDPNNESGIMALSASCRSADRNRTEKIKPAPRATKAWKATRPDVGSFGQRPGRKAQRGGDQHPTQPVETRGCIVDIAVDVAERQRDSSYRQRNVDQKGIAPAAGIDEPPAKDRSDRACGGSDSLPIYRSRGLSPLQRNFWPRMARLFGISIAALAPCAKRPSSNKTRVGATAQAMEAMPNTSTPAIKRRRRPYRSPAAPPSKRSALKGSK